MEVDKIIQGDCLEVMRGFPENSVDAICCDPPYGLSFMGKKWDYDVPSKEIWQECLRVLKPGGYLLSFAGTRTQHRMAVRIEDAGFEIRDMIAWVYGSGFPKSLNIGKAIDKLQGNEREVVDNPNTRDRTKHDATTVFTSQEVTGWDKTKGTSEWEGWGTALKPALEPITVARKPLSEKTVAENVLKWGTGGINIDESRVKKEEGDRTEYGVNGITRTTGNVFGKQYGEIEFDGTRGRFPANLITDGSEEVRECFPETKTGKAIRSSSGGKTFGGENTKPAMEDLGYDDNGGNASRFFKSIVYQAKASKSERNKGCEELEVKQTQGGGGGIGDYENDVNSMSGKYGSEKAPAHNNHPTVKPIALMEYLIKLVSREGALVLDPFAGSGSTLIACKKLGRNYIGCELDPEYIKIAEARIKAVQIDKQLSLI